MKKLLFLNYILQIFCIRLFIKVRHEYGRNIKSMEVLGSGIMYWIVPFTGWGSDFKHLGAGPKFWYIVKPRSK